jgi:multidrug efflux system membrane fusion protein
MVAAVILIGVGLHWGWPALGRGGDPGKQQASGGANSGEGGSGSNPKSGAATGESQPVPVQTTAAKSETVPVFLRGIGTVAAYNQVAVKSRVDGNITKVLFNEGQSVHAGDPLVQIDPRPYQALLDQAQGNAAKDQANLENARRDLTRYSALLQSQLAVTRQQYDTQRALVTQLEAAVQADQAVIEQAKLNVDYSTIRAPFDGITGLRQVDIGNLVQASAATALVTITQIKPIGVIFTVPERELDRIRAQAAKTKLTVLAFNGDDDRQLSRGELSVISNLVDQATGTITLKAIFPNDDAALWPGEFVNAHLVIETIQNGVTVPPAAVQMGPAGSFVYLVQPGSTVKPQPVTVTQVEGNAALIGKGLSAGQTIVVSGQSGLQPGTKVAAQQGQPGEMNAKEPEIGPEGVGSTGINTAAAGAGEINPR